MGGSARTRKSEAASPTIPDATVRPAARAECANTKRGRRPSAPWSAGAAGCARSGPSRAAIRTPSPRIRMSGSTLVGCTASVPLGTWGCCATRRRRRRIRAAALKWGDRKTRGNGRGAATTTAGTAAPASLRADLGILSLVIPSWPRSAASCPATTVLASLRKLLPLSFCASAPPDSRVTFASESPKGMSGRETATTTGNARWIARTAGPVPSVPERPTPLLSTSAHPLPPTSTRSASLETCTASAPTATRG
mmetsp:Transcript_34497/g.63758  ORF Transcript_34497/g.63758 Transcript_34497/m.63758 type:complete len:252 (+) Transcript_34497:648-1403(+)